MAWDNYDDREIAEGFKKARLNAGITIEALAEYTGISVLRIQNIELAAHAPTAEESKLLREGQEALGVFPQRKWLPLNDVAAFFGKSEQTIKRWVSQGRIDILKTSDGLFLDFYEVSKCNAGIYLARSERARNLRTHKKP